MYFSYASPHYERGVRFNLSIPLQRQSLQFQIALDSMCDYMHIAHRFRCNFVVYHAQRACMLAGNAIHIRVNHFAWIYGRTSKDSL